MQIMLAFLLVLTSALSGAAAAQTARESVRRAGA
jgi:hypothetical protein